MSKNVKPMKLSDIKIDSEIQSRKSINQEAVEDYSRVLSELPAGVVFFDGENNWLAGGFHRYFAHAHARKKEMPVEVRKGTRDDAIVFSAGENATNGVHRSSEDKRKAVLMLLKLPQFFKKSNAIIGAAAKVSKDLVSRIRVESGAQPTSTEGKDGVVRTTESNKKRAATAKAKKKAAAAAEGSTDAASAKTPETTPEAPPAAPPEPVKVEVGRDEKPIKREATQILFGQDERFKAVKSLAGGLKKALMELAGEKIGNFIEENDITERIQAIYNLIESARPFAECPYCVGSPKPGCKVCHKSGFITKPIYDNLPQEIKDGKAPADVPEEKKEAAAGERKKFRIGEKGRILHISQERADQMNKELEEKGGTTDRWHEVTEAEAKTAEA